MTRALTLRHATVAAESIPAYLDAVSRAVGRREQAGQHFWLFRHAERPGIFLEFREGPDASALAPDALEAELQQIAEYLEDDRAVWLEVRPGRTPSADAR